MHTIRSNLADQTARLVYADWLDEYDEPHLAAYVRAEVELFTLEAGSPAWERNLVRLAESSTAAGTNLGGWEYVSDLTRLTEKLQRLRDLDKRREVFGVSGHHYQLHPVPTESELVTFELRHGLTLPAEYRAFVLRMGNGGAGPDYGLHPLSLAGTDDTLRNPFPFTPEAAKAVAEAARAVQGGAGDVEVPQPDEDRWGHGYTTLCEHGCGNESVLVVTGPLRGQIWWQGDLGLVPDPVDFDNPPGFVAWYEEWLDKWLAPGAIEQWAGLFRKS